MFTGWLPGSPAAGMCTAIRPADPAWVDITARSSGTRSAVMESVGPMAAACRSALEKARSLAISLMTSPRGIAKAGLEDKPPPGSRSPR